MKPNPALVAEWYRRLRASGFEDLETANGLADRNQQAYAVATDPLVRQANAEYFEACAQHLETGSDAFETELERQTWALHTEGLNVREIGRRLGCSKSVAQRCVAKHRDLALASRER